MNSATATRPGQEDIAFQEKLYNDPNPTRRGLHLTRREWIETRLAAILKPDDKVLEVGVGCGVFTRFLAAQGVETRAVDINQAFLDGVADVRGVSIKNADATYDLGYRDIDVALCSEVLEHVPPARSQAMLDQFAASLKPGGTLILTTPQSFATVELMARLFKFPPVLALARKIYGTAEELGHINLLTRDQLRVQIARAGFRIAESALLGFYLPVIAEFGGKPGAALLRGIGNAIRPVPILRGLLWTQAYRLIKTG
jgi:2-polyprenyl-3-methyl-5-hydroxy-6-metoxy-1,4-benzoquinol methylase